uniref:CUB domain-containing protein n=1 Tax=Timema shepardi TaxID=629360 RepID=A0A7R9G1Y0_TIMSH|nr:unnamed protein product [Timema shepardi]
MADKKIAIAILCTILISASVRSTDDNNIPGREGIQRKHRNLMLYGSYGSLFMPQQQAQQKSENYELEDDTLNSVGTARDDSDSLVCHTQSGATGMCYTDAECEELGGMDLSSCADGEGVCCIVEKSCRNVTTQTVSYFVNPSYPKPDTIGSFCDFRIDVTNANVCQIRLDFDQFNILGPHRSMGICRNDRFMAMTSLPNGIGLSEMCGENTGQHIYVPVDASIGSASVSLMVMTSGLKPYEWRIQVTQIDCRDTPELVGKATPSSPDRDSNLASPSSAVELNMTSALANYATEASKAIGDAGGGGRAPAGCLQYFTEMSGTIQSFNYNKGLGHYQSNLDYAMCIKRSPNTCQVQFKQVQGSDFWINSIEDGRGGGSDELDAFGEPVPLSSVTSDKFCGRSLSGLAVVENAEKLRTGYILDPPDNTSFASTVTSYAAGPIVLRFHTDEATDPEQEIGFHISYQQLATGCMRNL